MIGFTVVGKPAATVMTSSPGRRRRSRSRGEVSAVSASRFADEPEFTSRAWRCPVVSRRRRSNASVSGPAVSQKGDYPGPWANFPDYESCVTVEEGFRAALDGKARLSVTRGSDYEAPIDGVEGSRTVH